MRYKGEKYIRHPKKPPPYIEENERIVFYDLLTKVGLDTEKYIEILKKLFLNKLSAQPKRYIHTYLEEDDYKYMKKIVYTLASLGFRFRDIHSLFLELFGDKNPEKWTKEYSKQTIKENSFLQSPVRIYLYTEEEDKLQTMIDTYIEKSELKYPEKEKQDKRLEELLHATIHQKINLSHLHTKKVLTLKELLELKKEDRRK